MTMLSLWQPILVSAVVVFIAGSVIWMAMPWHRTDWSMTEDEERVLVGATDVYEARCRRCHEPRRTDRSDQ